MKRKPNRKIKRLSDMRNLWRYKSARLMLKDLTKLLDLLEKDLRRNGKYKTRYQWN